MLALKDVRKYIAGLGIAADKSVYIGKLDSKQLKSIGVYNLKPKEGEHISLGGLKLTSYDIKPVSLLVHWNKSFPDTEEAAFSLYEKLQDSRGFKILDTYVNFIKMRQAMPVDIGTDDGGIYEFVIEIDIVYKRK